MKISKGILVAAAIALACLPAAAQFSIGPRLGVDVNSMRFTNPSGSSDRTVKNSNYMAGFTGGVQVEMMLPVANIGFDASLMFVHRYEQYVGGGCSYDYYKNGRNYLDIPINLKWKIGIPVIGKIITPYLFTGPSFTFLICSKDLPGPLSYKRMDIAWNVGLGLQLIKHLQIGASYGFGLNDTIDGDESRVYTIGKNRSWTIATAWLF